MRIEPALRQRLESIADQEERPLTRTIELLLGYASERYELFGSWVAMKKALEEG